MWTTIDKSLTYDGVKSAIKDTKKHIKQNPFEFSREFFKGQFHSKPINQRIDLYFHDYSMAPLFVQDLYPKSINHRPPNPADKHACSQYAEQVLDRVADAADSIADSDIIYKMVYEGQRFGLLPHHAVASCIRPG